MKKPTGTRKRLHFIMKAKDIDQQINEKVATCYIDDAELDNDGHSGASDHEWGWMLKARSKLLWLVMGTLRSQNLDGLGVSRQPTL